MSIASLKKPAIYVGQWVLFCFLQIFILVILGLAFLFYGVLIISELLSSFGVPASEVGNFSLWLAFFIAVVCFIGIWSFIWWILRDASNYYGRLVAATIPLVTLCLLFRPAPDSPANSMVIIDVPVAFYFACVVTATIMFVLLGCVLRWMFRMKRRWGVVLSSAMLVVVSFLIFLGAYHVEPIIFGVI